MTKLIFSIIFYLTNIQLTRAQDCNCGDSNMATFHNYKLANKECPEPPDYVNLFVATTNATGIFTRRYMICCCITGEKQSNFLPTWTFQGKPLDKYKWKISKGNTGISKSYLDMEDTGEYSCSFETLKLTRTAHLNILKSDPYCGRPQNSQISPNSPILVLSGKGGVKWRCTAYVGEFWPGANHSLQFFKSSRSESLRSINNINVDVKISSEGVIEGELNIKKVQKYDYGDYFCLISNYHHQVSLNFSLINGVPEHDIKIGNLRTLVTVFCAVTAMIIIFFSYWLRCRIFTILMCKDNIRERRIRADSEDEFQFDLFIVHGEDSEKWVTLQLLPVIEKGAKYLCFVPSRDMLAGKSIAEQVSRVMHRSRRALVIVSPLLLDCEWAVLASYSAVSESLRSGGRCKIIVIILEKLKELPNHPSKHAKLLRLLTEFPSIEAPPLVRQRKLSSEEIKKIVRKFFFSIFLIRNPHMNILDHESIFDVGRDVCIREDHLHVVHESLKVKSISKTMVRLFWFQIHSVFTKDLTHQFWSNIFSALPPSPIQLSDKNSLLKRSSFFPNQSNDSV